MSSRLRRLRHALNVRLVRAVERGVATVVEDRVLPRLDALEVRAREQAAALDAARGEIDGLRAELVAREIRDRRDMFAAGEREAVVSSARFVEQAMPGARPFPNPAATLAHALEIAPRRGGLALEFGVFSGTTLRAIAAARGDGEVYGFDSFQGLPEDWRAGFGAGTFAVGEPPEVPGAELVVGWFADTLPAFLAEHPEPVDLLHLDADLHSSTATVLEHVGPRLRPGSVIVFDEYLNHPGWEDGEHRAWTEYVARTGLDFTYEAFTHDHEQVVVVVRSTPPSEQAVVPEQHRPTADQRVG
ncbi:class I SAM-dependent methyltransferase [Actinomycetospora sp. DW7H6]|uniref:Class I SAM-dependent methyltransferase n=1 Tax=Actinomycetospora lemnae TaxID=3019891 RepID=A0ABT5SU32_9PSEU|nr:class I SAM-dependent methyltransferase [Actinomycetospora sp. DW7H6]MDD7966371.1 class I SAM-dependent methyltransferase [Actinomycetospora sp. DW7H6]